MSESVIIIPTYNEKENVEKMVRKIFSLPHSFHILIVDDNSPDGTAGIVKKLVSEFPSQLYLEERSGKSEFLVFFCVGVEMSVGHIFILSAMSSLL